MRSTDLDGEKATKGFTKIEILRNREAWAKEALKRNPTSRYHKGYLEAVTGAIRLLEDQRRDFRR